MSTKSDWLQKSTAKGKAELNAYLKKEEVKAAPFMDMEVYAAKQLEEAKTKAMLKKFVAYEHATIAKQNAAQAAFDPTSISPGSNISKLTNFVEQIIQSDPHSFEEFQWAARPQDWWCAQLNISVANLRRIIARPPFVRERIHVDGKIMTLIRVGKPMPQTPYGTAKRMAALWRKLTGKYPTKKEFGCMVGLAEIWPSGKQLDILATALGDWTAFMAGVKLEISIKKAQGGEVVWHYFDYPSLTVIRCFQSVAVELYSMEVQAQFATKEWKMN